jgi:hypothetical protein
MTKPARPRFRHLLPVLLLLGACAWEDRSVRISGAETQGAAGRTSVVPAALTRTREGVQLELVTADGVALAGPLRRETEPVVVPLSAGGAPLVGGGTVLRGEIAGGGTALACTFRLLNPARGADGGGSGRCEGSARQVDFIF